MHLRIVGDRDDGSESEKGANFSGFSSALEQNQGVTESQPHKVHRLWIPIQFFLHFIKRR